MATVRQSIEVNVPPSQAYNQWTQFEDFPRFMSGVDAVRQLDDSTVHFETSIRGVKREYDARITGQEPDQRVSWESLDEPRNAGTVRFEPLEANRTKVSVELTWEPESAAEKAGAAVGLDSRQVASDLKRFKKFIEERDVESGAWRGRVDDATTGGAPAGAVGAPAGAAGAPAGAGSVESDGTTAVPLQEEAGSGDLPTTQHVNADPDLAPDPPFGNDRES
ncbi:ribosome-associated toxin RatA of RatAB toxin-antitoxin module [Arthrobacter sp. V4I6]|uniref:SRPBCC family protein n=1 Tax=unclassified Arthrobacter TaxID=235627 RepID=UPI00278ADAAE|nr:MULTISPECIES: SRPBCC family protein [unclassified Arthrobacter]MDQ0822233.1 ribosome-associated toxin RatA of RatAB toxin-antitoxin module [Arthrobacter sp. V1I7]MDQ0856501.1 ribosome-associated toxin RatA of RatAB toxin-antitoxin module [Arthrobacter sp. V4I6]